MKRVRIGIIGGGSEIDWAILPALSGSEMAAPPDSGAWWGRRATLAEDIAYQPPARVELVALADENVARLYRTAAAWRIRAPYSDWRQMLREAQIDALVASPELEATQRREVLEAARERNLWLWLPGPPASGARDIGFAAPRVWCSHYLNSAAAHRAARRLVESGRLGAVSALALRWPRALSPDSDNPNFAATYAAFSLLVHFASLPPREGGRIRLPQGARVAASETGGATNVWLRFAHGLEGRALSATALFTSADGWNTAFPRLEITGTEGRAVECEAGRRVVLTEPREAARILELPGLAPHVSQSNVVGIAEDLKLFLAHVAEAQDSNEANERAWHEAAAALRLLEAVREALSTGAMIETDLVRAAQPQTLPTEKAAAEAVAAAPLQPVLRLPLHE
ncbi:MAG TPA: hypothetical protein VF681_01535 [Abditibacteriaceae bacterium]|jgi:predicted dehydrogenase